MVTGLDESDLVSESPAWQHQEHLATHIAPLPSGSRD